LILSNATNNFGGTVVESGYLTVTTIGALPTNEALSIAAGGTFVFDPLAAQNSDSLAALTGGAAAASPAGGLAVVPEPGTLVLLLAALCSAAACYRFSKRAENRRV
jgi:hypothetical protein